MEQIKLRALCVRSIDYKDNDSLITLASLEKGKIVASVRGSKKQRSKLRFSASLFCFGEYILNVSQNGKYTVVGCDLIDGFYPLREDVERFYEASIIAEILEKNLLVLPNDKLIYTAIKGLKEIAYEEKDDLTSLIEFCYNALIISGYTLPSVECKTCRSLENLYFDTISYDFVCKLHKSNKGILVGSKEVEGLRLVANYEYEKLSCFPKNVKLNILYLIVTYFALIGEHKYKTLSAYFDILKKID